MRPFRTCRYAGCPEAHPDIVTFCDAHLQAWSESLESERAVRDGSTEQHFANTALMDFINRIEAELRNGTPEEK
jgi:hypothetical protein